MKIKIIDLFNKIANGEKVPKEIKVLGNTYIWNEAEQFYEEKAFGADLLELCDSFSTSELVKAEAEIVEDNEIKELELEKRENENQYLLKTARGYFTMRRADVFIVTKINELVNEIKKMKEGKNE